MNTHLKAVAKAYRASADYHELKAQIANAEGDPDNASLDRQRACEYRKLARRLEVQLEEAA